MEKHGDLRVSHGDLRVSHGDLRLLNYYNEYHDSNKTYLYNSKLRFLGIEYEKKNPLMRFEMSNGSQIRRQVLDVMYYEHVPTDNDNYTDEDIKNIKFKEIKYTDLKTHL